MDPIRLMQSALCRTLRSSMPPKVTLNTHLTITKNKKNGNTTQVVRLANGAWFSTEGTAIVWKLRVLKLHPSELLFPIYLSQILTNLAILDWPCSTIILMKLVPSTNFLLGQSQLVDATSLSKSRVNSVS